MFASNSDESSRCHAKSLFSKLTIVIFSFQPAPTNPMTASTPHGFTAVTAATVAADFPAPSVGVSQADALPHLTTAPSGAPEPLTHLSSLKPVPSRESKALGSTATATVASTTSAGDSSVSQHCESLGKKTALRFPPCIK